MNTQHTQFMNVYYMSNCLLITESYNHDRNYKKQRYKWVVLNQFKHIKQMFYWILIGG